MKKVVKFDEFVNESAREFSGAPLMGGFFFPIILASMGQDLLNRSGGKNISLGNLLLNISKLVSNDSVLYFNLFQEMNKINSELSPWWNENYKRMGGTLGSGKNIMKDVSTTRDETDEDFQAQLEGIDPSVFNKFQGLVTMLGDRNHIRKFIDKSMGSENIQLEQIEILRGILFTVFMSIFKPGYLRKAEDTANIIAKRIPSNPNLN